MAEWLMTGAGWVPGLVEGTMSRARTVVTALVVALLTACALVVVLAKRQINLSRAYLELR